MTVQGATPRSILVTEHAQNHRPLSSSRDEKATPRKTILVTEHTQNHRPLSSSGEKTGPSVSVQLKPITPAIPLHKSALRQAPTKKVGFSPRNLKPPALNPVLSPQDSPTPTHSTQQDMTSPEAEPAQPPETKQTPNASAKRYSKESKDSAGAPTFKLRPSGAGAAVGASSGRLAVMSGPSARLLARARAPARTVGLSWRIPISHWNAVRKFLQPRSGQSKAPGQSVVATSRQYEASGAASAAAPGGEQLETVHFYSQGFQRFWKRGTKGGGGFSPRSRRLSEDIPRPTFDDGPIFELRGFLRGEARLSAEEEDIKRAASDALKKRFGRLPADRVLGAAQLAFRSFDDDHRGSLDPHELAAAFQSMGADITEDKALRLSQMCRPAGFDGPKAGMSIEEFEDLVLQALRLPGILRPDRCRAPNCPRPAASAPTDRRPDITA